MEFWLVDKISGLVTAESIVVEELICSLSVDDSGAIVDTIETELGPSDSISTSSLDSETVEEET
jgi:hypothetical protein